MATYRYVFSNSVTTYTLANLSKEGSYTKSALNYTCAEGVSDDYGDHNGGYIYTTSLNVNSYTLYGTSGSYYYSYLSSNYIDPTAVALTANPVAGASATIKVTPRNNSYGTVSYLYQYSTNGGSSYTTIATSSATSYSFSVPSGATSIKVRVRAQDNIGFTSSTYVESSN